MPTRRRSRDIVATIVIAALLAFGGRFGRRAALRGVLSALLAGLVARVLGSDRTHARWTARHAAFATGVGLESPGWGRVLAAGSGAAGIVARRPDRGDRRGPTDALVGTAVGTSIALVSRRWWPVASREPAAVRRPRGSDVVPVGADGEGLAVVVNPGAGPALSGNPAPALREALPAADIIELGDGDDVIELARAAAASARVLGACGGDGTLNAVASVALDHGLPFLAVPGGTLNHFARDIGLATVDDAIAAVRTGRVAEIDVGVLADRRFLNTASFGAYPELVDARERLESRIGKWPALAWSLVHVLRHASPCRVDLDGVRHDVWMVFIGNCAYEPAGFAPSWRERLDDGQLDLRLVDARHPWARTRLVAAVLTGTLARSRVHEQRLVRRMDVTSHDGALRLATDGETFTGAAQFSIEKDPRRLRLVVAAGDDDEDGERVP
ncbi:MAG TPA: diacylglycerol kinase family protein [Acidimicrobiia bacterium]|nr:diacylglycerol kinase family protein [Acidimicrobiia bacterium]